MGDLVRDALRATGIDEEVEQLIANAIVQSLSENRSKNAISQPSTERKLRDKANRPNLARVRVIAEHLWRRLEQIYDVKLQTWKRNEEKVMEEMIMRLRHEYRESLLLKQKQLDELAGRKDIEYKNKEDFLREDIRVTFEKELRFQRELLENARANFQSKKDNELCLIEKERCSLEQIKDGLKIHEKNLDQRLQEAIRKAREKDRTRIMQMISEWNKKEAILSKKYELVWDKICEISNGQEFSAKEAACFKKLQEKVIQQQRKLTETNEALHDALNMQQKTNEDLENVKKEKEKLSETNRKLMEKLERRNATINSLKKQLKLLEESAALRISELKFQHKLAVDKLQALSKQLDKYRFSTFKKFDRPSSHPSTPVSARMTMIDSMSSSTPTESSFEQHFRDRMKVLDCTKQELDFALNKLRIRSQSHPLDHIQSISLSHAETNELEKPQSRNSSNHELLQRDPSVIKTNSADEKMEMEQHFVVHSSPENIENTEGVTSNSPGKHTVDPLMVRYMKIIQSQREKVEPLLQQTSKEDTQLSEELFVIETGERLNTSSTPSDFGW
ncbi:Uncharacterized protein BM_BM9736 [Brugia malayi]|uniref:Bm9736 n=1 Tax=Brugia malayi TaxID=6279 RepID=A0A0I9N563_BRUMA|nr:Uncharacterized protein BM_BM9736 [Brugia malayi]CTP81209.1 Bm9736 [Brugia malayi]VIO93566.1 Uncharacterized protein BM_BM9736 [Brugia malayi]